MLAHKRTLLMIGLVLMVLLIAACLQATPPPTYTPAPPTSTPGPTQEPSPTPSPEPIAITAPSTEIPPEAFATLLAVGNSLYQSGEYVMASALYTEMLDRDPDPEVFALRADTNKRMGDFDAVIADYLAAVDLGTDNDVILNNLCWHLGITGQAEKALPYCEQAVEAEPSASHRDSRGVTYAQLGRIQGALADFQAVVDDLKDATDSSLKTNVAERQEWIVSLEKGVNPITPEVLAQLRDEEVAIAATSTPVPSTVPVPRSAVQESAGEAGFTFGEVTASGGEETLAGNREEGACKAVLKLVGPEEGLTAASLQASGCTDNEQSGLAYWFMVVLLPGEREQAKAIMYLVLDIYYVIEGVIEATGEQEIGNVIFETRHSADPTPVFKVTARFKR
jgi:tetratricopeptide (TPR) repeat protein